MRSESMFEYVLRNKVRFPSSRGDLTVEQLWEVPLRARDDFNLNAIAKTVHKSVKDLSEENFVDIQETSARKRAETMLDVVKYVIDTKQAEEQAAKDRAENKVERERLLKILAEKQDGELSELSIKDLKKRIAALEDG